MITTTVTLTVTGKSHDDLLIEAKRRLADFFDIPLDEESLSRINFDMVVKERQDVNEFEEDEDEYEAEIIAKVKEHV